MSIWLFVCCSVSWSSRAAFQESPSQSNAKGCVLVYLVRSSELQHTKLSRLVSIPVLFMDKWKELGLDEVPEFYRDLSLFSGNVSNSPPVLLCFHSLTAPSRPVLILSPPHRHTHTHTAASFLTATGSGDRVSVCVIVCHENGIWGNGWRNSGGEMQS